MSSTQKVALITGAARRIGRAIALRLHQSGFRVIVHYRHSQAEAESFVEELNAKQVDSAIALACDLNLLESVEAFANQCIQVWGRLDCLVNNASTFYETPFGTVQLSDWRDLMASNLEAPFHLSQACSKELTANGGNIINIIDYFADVPLKGYSIYSIAKAGLSMLTKSLALELGPEVRVNGVSPTVALWPEGENTLDESTKNKILNQTILKKSGGAQSIAETVHFLVNNADYMTGQILLVDGGRSIKGTF